MIAVEYLWTADLFYSDECSVIGVDPERGDILIEEVDQDDLLTRYRIDRMGKRRVVVDEHRGDNLAALPIPVSLIGPNQPTAHSLNFVAGRWRGLREQEGLLQQVLSLPIVSKMDILKYLNLDIPPMLLLGLVESRVLSSVICTQPSSEIVCRRVRLAYALSEPRYAGDGLPYDYDTVTLYIAHFTDTNKSPEDGIADALRGFGGISLTAPVDCLSYENQLYILDSGLQQRSNRLHSWQISRQNRT